ncbi:MAG: radical SAM protein [Nitrospinota bacterium]|nr:MAG: radical SAM protein [Nitrospinota bacterium]
MLECILPETGEQVLINIRWEAISIAIDATTVFTFDREGRLVGAYLHGKTFRRGMDNRVLAKWRVREDGKQRRIRQYLPQEEKRELLTAIYQKVAQIFTALSTGQIVPISSPALSLDTVREDLAPILRYDFSRLEAERRQFYQVYRPVGILPPDQYATLVLQATEGCSYNRCTFCRFYKDIPFRIKEVAEFRQHLQAVQRFFGRALRLKKSLFFGEANALVIPQHRLLPLFDVVNETFTICPEGLSAEARKQWKREHPLSFRGIYAFLDAFSSRKKRVEDFQALKARNLRRVYIGLETGSNRLLQLLHKAGTAQDAIEAVHKIKAGGIAVGIIVMLGVGGDLFAETHVEETGAVLREMHLEEDDLLYFSPLVVSPDLGYAREANRLGIRPLTEEEMERQKEAILQAYQPGPNGPRVSLYDIQEFIY